jgi:ABC-type dipeptide/oligopeptide/nickel transport system permease component
VARLAQDGASVVVNDFDEDPAEQAVETARPAEAKAIAKAGNLGGPHFGNEVAGVDSAVGSASARLGLDRPLAERYLDWIGGILTLDFGQTLLPPIQPVAEIVGSALPVTMQLA